MDVGAAHEAELERVHAELRLELQAAQQPGAQVVGRHHLGRERLVLEREVAVLPSGDTQVAGELVVGRERRVRLAVALRLHHLLQDLPTGAALGVVLRQRVAAEVHELEHPAVRQVAVLRDGEEPAAGHRRPLVADHRGEAARLVEPLRGSGVLLPHGLHDRTDDLRVLHRRRQPALRLAGDRLRCRLRGLIAAAFIAFCQRARIGSDMNAGLPANTWDMLPRPSA